MSAPLPTSELANRVAGHSFAPVTGSAPYYEDRYVKLYHGNSMELVGDFVPECVLTDPPYGVGLKYASYQDTPENWQLVKAFMCGLIERSKQVALMTGQRSAWEMPRPKWMLCWAKPGSCRRSDLGGFNEWEPVLLYGKWRKVNNDLKWLPNCNNYHTDAAAGHPCPKPTKLMTWLVSLTDGEILDPFAGSGSTLLAAKQLNRKAVGIEIEEKYCEIIAKRLEQDVFDMTDGEAQNARMTCAPESRQDK